MREYARSVVTHSHAALTSSTTIRSGLDSGRRIARYRNCVNITTSTSTTCGDSK